MRAFAWLMLQPKGHPPCPVCGGDHEYYSPAREVAPDQPPCRPIVVVDEIPTANPDDRWQHFLTTEEFSALDRPWSIDGATGESIDREEVIRRLNEAEGGR